MRKVELRMNEQNKYEIIKKLVETNGNKKRAATRLGCTVRTIGSLTVVSIFSLTKSLKTLIISMLLSFFIVKFVKLYVGICRNS